MAAYQSGRGDRSILPGMTTRAMLGHRLKALRVSKGASQADVAEATNLSRSFVAMLEKGSTEVAVARLYSLADYFGVTLSDLIGEDDPAVEYVPGELARAIPTDDEGVTLELLARRSSAPMQPYRIVLDPGVSLDGLAHGGDEWVTCVAGGCTMTVGATTVDLRVGDTLFFPARLNHAYHNDSGEQAVLIGCTLVLAG